jgi:hypothetical protein
MEPKLKQGAVIKVLVESSITKKGHIKGYWLVRDVRPAWFGPKLRSDGTPYMTYGVVRCTPTGKPFKYDDGFRSEWVDRWIDEGKVLVVRA